MKQYTHQTFTSGGRVGGTAFIHSQQAANSFEGLEEGMSRYDLLFLVKKIGRLAGFTPRLIQLLEYYMAFTTELDWEEGASPIVFQSLAKTSLDLGISERQIQRMEKKLCDLGALTWRDFGNHKRFGKRCETSGLLLFAYGVDLSPLAALVPHLRDLLERKQQEDRAWIETKRAISGTRRAIKGILAQLIDLGVDIEAFSVRFSVLAYPIRAHIDLQKLRALLTDLTVLMENVQSALSDNMSSRGDETVTHIEYKTNPKTDKSETSKAKPIAIQDARKANSRNQESRGPTDISLALKDERRDLILKTGLQHIELRHILKASSDRFIDELGIGNGVLTWGDIVETTYRLSKGLKISDLTWRFACSVLGRTGAAVCLILTERGLDLGQNRVRNPSAYFSAMISRARAGELNLDNAVFAILNRALSSNGLTNG